MKRLVLALCLLSPAALACDTSHLKLSGAITLSTCHETNSPDCVYAGEAVHQYMDAVPDSDAVFTIGLPSSPWRLYDAEMRILTVDEVAEVVRSKLDGKVQRVELIGSWTGVSPEPGVLSLADRVSKALGGFPVQGEDGFLWLAQDGTRRTTRQAFTMRDGAGSYFLPKGAEVLVPLATGWPAYVEDMIPEDDAGLLMRAAAGWDVRTRHSQVSSAPQRRAAPSPRTTRPSCAWSVTPMATALPRSHFSNRAWRWAMPSREHGWMPSARASSANLNQDRSPF